MGQSETLNFEDQKIGSSARSADIHSEAISDNGMCPESMLYQALRVWLTTHRKSCSDALRVVPLLAVVTLNEWAGVVIRLLADAVQLGLSFVFLPLILHPSISFAHVPQGTSEICACG